MIMMFDTSAYVKIRFLVNVNGFKRGDIVLIDPLDEMFSGFIEQRMVRVISDGV